jgi:hypothetical protein
VAALLFVFCASIRVGGDLGNTGLGLILHNKKLIKMGYLMSDNCMDFISRKGTKEQRRKGRYLYLHIDKHTINIY